MCTFGQCTPVMLCPSSTLATRAENFLELTFVAVFSSNYISLLPMFGTLVATRFISGLVCTGKRKVGNAKNLSFASEWN